MTLPLRFLSVRFGLVTAMALGLAGAGRAADAKAPAPAPGISPAPVPAPAPAENRAPPAAEGPLVVVRSIRVSGAVPAPALDTPYGSARLVFTRRPSGSLAGEVHFIGGTVTLKEPKFIFIGANSAERSLGRAGLLFMGETSAVAISDMPSELREGVAIRIKVEGDTTLGGVAKRLIVTHTFRLRPVPEGQPQLRLDPERSWYQEIDTAPEKAADPFAAWTRPEGMLELAIPERRPSGEPNPIAVERAGRRFAFDPRAGTAIFERVSTPGGEPERTQVKFPPSAAEHAVTLTWAEGIITLGVDDHTDVRLTPPPRSGEKKR